MSGTFRSGRPGKSAEQHKAQGTYRASRHAKNTGLPIDGEPKKPRGLSKDERWLWDQVMQAYAGKNVLVELDTALLQSAAELWSLYRASLKEAKKNPCDKICRVAVISYWATFERAASRLGLDPAARARLLIDASDALKNDPISPLKKGCKCDLFLFQAAVA
jgi:P27 family predicted phage terminase small subunit